MPGEVITLQFGSFANFVGSHYWNFQDEVLGLQEQPDTASAASQIDSGVLYRSGETLQGHPTYTPRLVLFDLSGSLGSLSPQGCLYGGRPAAAAAAAVRSWHGGVEVHRRPPAAKPRFLQELEEEPEAELAEGGAEPAAPSALEATARDLDEPGAVAHHSDFLKAHVHPRSACLLPGAWSGAADMRGYGGGGAHFTAEWLREDAMERIRFFAEECDTLQGFQVFVDDTSGFGAAASTVLQEVRDSYGSSRPALLFAVRPDAEGAAAGGSNAERRLGNLSQGTSLALLSQQCDVYCVTAPPADASALGALCWRRGDAFHTSAICAAAIEAATTPYRLSTGPGGGIGRSSLASQVQALTSQRPTPLAALSLSMPCPPLPADPQGLAEQADSRVRHAPAGRPPPPLPCASLTPGVPAACYDSFKYAETSSLRGPAAGDGGAAAALDAVLLADGARCVRHRSLCSLAMPVPLPFPRFFTPAAVALCGLAPSGAVAACPLLSRLCATPALGSAAAATEQRFGHAAGGPQGQAVLEAWGLGREELLELGERMSALRNAYDPGSD